MTRAWAPPPASEKSLMRTTRSIGAASAHTVRSFKSINRPTSEGGAAWAIAEARGRRKFDHYDISSPSAATDCGLHHRRGVHVLIRGFKQERRVAPNKNCFFM